ncbi:hypothetical protein PHJA_002439000 [Phtheirospermum japonicum]|uniref:Uncharacterized protein n=1 Tax=Phtheirospermum japonicum TaxID=374723 RepID=A0A830D9F1_9LAMI|nr:hypothetical protein PHJA_002439000 [Phtheirospermum japonicum]
MEVEPPSVVRYLIRSAIMMLGVVLPVGYMMFRNKRVPSSSSYSKQTCGIARSSLVGVYLKIMYSNYDFEGARWRDLKERLEKEDSKISANFYYVFCHLKSCDIISWLKN